MGCTGKLTPWVLHIVKVKCQVRLDSFLRLHTVGCWSWNSERLTKPALPAPSLFSHCFSTWLWTSSRVATLGQLEFLHGELKILHTLVFQETGSGYLPSLKASLESGTISRPLYLVIEPTQNQGRGNLLLLTIRERTEHMGREEIDNGHLRGQ